jgi:sortase A
MSGKRFRKRHILLVLCSAVCTLILLRLIKSVLAARGAERDAADAGEPQQPEATTAPVTQPEVEEVQHRVSPDRRQTRPERRPAKRVRPRPKQRSPRFSAEKVWLGIEVGAVLLFVVVGALLLQTRRELNESYRTLQQTNSEAMPTLVAAANPGQLPESLAQANQAADQRPLPTPFPTATPVFAERSATSQAVADTARDQQVAQAATAQQDPTFQQSPNIAQNTAAVMQKRASEPEQSQSRQLQIPAIGVDNHIFQYDGGESLKLGVVQVGQPVAPGEEGNLVLAAHNDIYGEIFRDLDHLQVGDEVILSGDNRSYTYRVRETLIVEPDDVWVTLPTSKPTLTLVSCYPYLVDTHRIVVFADLVQ